MAGTTPLAREILRKLLFGLEQRLTNREPMEQLVAPLEAQLKTFWELQPEFALLLSRLWGGEPEAWLETPPHDFATLVVLGSTMSLSCRRAGQPSRR